MNINLVNILFLTFYLSCLIIGILLTFGKILPQSIVQIFVYGKHAFKDEKSTKFVEKIEVPKSWFGHYYFFAMLLSGSVTTIAACAYLTGHATHELFIEHLDLICGKNREVKSEKIV